MKRAQIISRAMLPLALLLAVVLCLIVPWYGEVFRLLLPGLVLSAPCLLVGLCKGKKLCVSFPSLLLGVLLTAFGVVIAYVFPLRVQTSLQSWLSATFNEPFLFLLAGILLGCAVQNANHDACRIRLRSGWLVALLPVALLFAVLVAMQSLLHFASPFGQNEGNTTLLRALVKWVGFGKQLLPLCFGALILLPRGERRVCRVEWWVLCGVSLAFLVMILGALLAQIGVLRSVEVLKQLNQFFYMRVKMADVTACLLVVCGMVLRNGLPVLLNKSPKKCKAPL